MTEIFNLHSLCRCCHSDGNFKSLQLSYVYDNHIEVYSTMLKETLDVTINAPPIEASYAICDCCITKLRNASYFKQQVLECEQKFEEYCKNEQALSIKEEVDYDSSNDADLGREAVNTDVYDHEDQEYKKCKDEKKYGEISEYTINVVGNLNDDIDDKYHVKIKKENQVVPSKCNQQIPIEYAKPDRASAQVSGRILKRNGVKATVKIKRTKVDPKLEVHIKTEDDVTYACKICSKKYNVLKALRKHIRNLHHTYKCQNCSLQIVGRPHYLKHIKIHAGELFKCHLCQKSFPTNSTLLNHLDVHTRTKQFQCDLCQKMFSVKSTLKKHIMWHFGVTKKSICDICGHGFNDTTNLNIHIRTVHQKLRPYKCHLCPKTFTANKHLKEHSYTHTGEKPFKCELCNDGFAASWKLRHHKLRYHPQSAGGEGEQERRKVYTCKVCNLQIAHRGKFMSHVKGHSGQKDYKCHLCTKDFTCRYSLNRHVITHSGIKSYACDQCDWKFFQATQLWRHKKRIHDPNPVRVVQKVKCDLCNKSFKNINKHMVSHKSRPHVCEICLKSYPERNTLNRHILVVHQGVKRHPCTLCEKKYCKLESLQKHTRKIHKLELKKEVDES